MGYAVNLWRDIMFFMRMGRVFSAVRKIKSGAGYGNLLPDVIEQSVDRNATRLALITPFGQYTYEELDHFANRVAHWGLSQGLKPGAHVALFMANSAEYVGIWFGLSKIGVRSALLNNQLIGASLAHCLDISEADHAIVDGDLVETFEAARPQFSRAMTTWRMGGGRGGEDFSAALDAQPRTRPDPAVRADIPATAPALRMYTSGTTGLPKAADVTHIRARMYMTGFFHGAKATASDRMLIVLPLYHATGGLCAIGCALLGGGAAIIDKRFSASRFWDLASDFGATMMIYVGELCRFLAAAPDHPKQRQHNIRVAIGNGLRPDVWERFQSKFDIPWIMEFYGSTEGNVSLINLDNTVSAVGRIPPVVQNRFNARIAAFDHDAAAPRRGPDGRGLAAKPGEVGEMLGRINPKDPRHRFDGYSGQRGETEKKILRDVFEKGDAWFRTGDLMKIDKRGYVYFVDRVGDTYRWKSENVATSEVSEALSVFPGVIQANVYGVPVPGYDGKAGMAAIQLDGHVDFHKLGAHLGEVLPPYARPVFLRVQSGDRAGDTTGTFKFKKTDLVRQGFDPGQVDDLLYVTDGNGGYVPLNSERFTEIASGEARF